MSSQPPDPNMFTSPFQLTQAMHRDVYSLVDPSDPTVREAGGGKVVLITGAAGGLGWVCIVLIHSILSQVSK